MKKWVIIILSTIAIIILAYLIVRDMCRTIQLETAYTNPAVKYHKTVRKTSATVLKSDTTVKVDKADKITLLPDGSYEFLNPVNIVLGNTTSSTVSSKTELTESGVSKPDLTPFTQKDWLVGLEYVHLNGDKDLQKLFIAKRVILDLYIGVGIYNRADFFQEDYSLRYGWQNISVGVYYIF